MLCFRFSFKTGFPISDSEEKASAKVFASHLKTTFANHHRILRQVGEGTYGHVYEAETVLPGAPMEEVLQILSFGFGFMLLPYYII